MARWPMTDDQLHVLQRLADFGVAAKEAAEALRLLAQACRAASQFLNDARRRPRRRAWWQTGGEPPEWQLDENEPEWWQTDGRPPWEEE